MGTLYISEFTAGASHVVTQPPVAEQAIQISHGAALSEPFDEHTKILRLHCDAPCRFAVGRKPAITETSARLAANQTEYFSVSPGDKVAVISA